MRRCLILIILLLPSCDKHDTAQNHRLLDPNPAFSARFASANKLEFVPQTYPKSDRTSIEISATSEVAAFLDSFSFEKFPEGEITRCMCGGDPHVVITMDDGSTQQFTLHHGRSIRWDGFESDLRLTQASKARLNEFLERHEIQSR